MAYYPLRNVISVNNVEVSRVYYFYITGHGQGLIFILVSYASFKVVSVALEGAVIINMPLVTLTAFTPIKVSPCKYV